MRDFSELKEGETIKAQFTDEPVRIIKKNVFGPRRVRIEGEGKETGTFYKPILSLDDLSKIKVDQSSCNLEGEAKNLYLRLLSEQIRQSYGSDPLFGLSISKVDPVPHQLEAIYDYILKKPSQINFLLADDAGAGKTIMAGLLLKELEYRGLANRVLVVAPKFLNYQWRRELREKFGEEFSIVDRGVLESFPRESAWKKLNSAITSVDFAKQEEIRRRLRDVRWDLVIVDEAHKLAAYKEAKNKIRRTQRFKLGRVLEKNADNLLLLSATPHKGDMSHFFFLLSLLDKDIFDPKLIQRNVLTPSEINERITNAIHNEDNPIFLRRMKEDMKQLDGSPLFPPRKSTTLKYSIQGKEKELYDAVTNYVERYYRKATRQKRTNVAFALIIIQRRFASSIHAGRKTLERRLQRIEGVLKQGRIEKAFELAEHEKLWEELQDLPEEERWERLAEKLQDLPEEERWEIEDMLSTGAETGKLSSAEHIDELKLEKKKLEKLVELAREVENSIEERKLQELWEVLDREELLKTGNKLLVFTEAKPTLFYLRDKFQQRGFNTTTIHGDKSTEKREEAEKSFNEGNAQIMIATEAAGEGINLQESCWLMVNYDIPWNPNKLEQRMGRIHRYGQDRTVHVYNLVAKNTREGRVLTVVLDKLDKIRSSLGTDKVFDVVGQLFEGKNLETLVKQAITKNKPAEVYDRLEEVDEDAVEKIQEYTKESLAKKHIDLSRINELIQKNKEEKLPPEYIKEFFLKAFKNFDGRIEERENGKWYIKYVPANIRNISDSEEFRRRYGRVKERYGLVTFRSEVAQHNDIEFIAPDHPLLEALIQIIQQRFSEDSEKGAIFYDPDGRYNGVIWLFKSKFKDGLNKLIDKKIVPIYFPLKGKPKVVDLNLLWDLVPGGGKAEKKYLELLKRKNEVFDLVMDELDQTKVELRKRRKKEAEIRRNYASKTLKDLIADSETKIVEYQNKQAKGEDMDLKIQEESARKKRLKERRKKVIKESELKKDIYYEDPSILTSIAVKPHPSPTIKDMYRDEEVERVAMEVAMSYEREEGREPEDVSDQNLGYDLKSSGSSGTRYIEVKGRAEGGRVSLSVNEWIKAKRLEKEAWLYIVTNSRSEPQLNVIRNPASHLKPQEKVRYIVSQKKWSEHAEEVK